MTTLNFSDLLKHHYSQISVPSNTENMTVLEAALVWAANGFFILPIDSTTKNAGTVVGRGWPEKSSRDPQQIEKWFQPGTTYGLAIHLGKSGAIAFDVDDIVLEIARLKEEGFVVLNEVPKKGADNKLVAFLHPKTTNGVLIELCQEMK